ncbi:MAG: tagaturonate reductase [Saccharofermentanales bacterium]|jgi:tagaturonate reductase
MQQLNKSIIEPFAGKERFLQFGEGNFLRGFADYFIDILNEKYDYQSKIVVVQPINTGLASVINEQDGLYTLYLRGLENGQKVEHRRIIRSISRCLNPYAEYETFLENAHNPDLRFIVSNTTEAGITFVASDRYDDKPPSSFPGKLTRFLHERFLRFGKEAGKGFVILSCELIENNGQELKKCVERYIQDWELGDGFAKWVSEENIFCSTLVDRIVTGYPHAEADKLNKQNGYVDRLLDTAEVFGLWVIEGPDSLAAELPFAEAGLPVIFTNDHSPYKKRKVRILNGAHTGMIMAAYLAGFDLVRDCLEDDIIRDYLTNCMFDEIIPTLDLPKAELHAFAKAVIDRFRNPFIDHQLLSIALNSTSKWQTRILPSLLEYHGCYGKLPQRLVFSLAAYIKFYSGQRKPNGSFVGTRSMTRGEKTISESYEIKDDAFVLEFFEPAQKYDNKTLAAKVLANKNFWDEDLTCVEGLLTQVVADLNLIDKNGMYGALKIKR